MIRLFSLTLAALAMLSPRALSCHECHECHECDHHYKKQHEQHREGKKLPMKALDEHMPPSQNQELQVQEQPIQEQKICATIAPLGKLCGRFLEKMGAQAQAVKNIIVLIPSDVDPHHYEPTLSSLQGLQGVTLWLRCGEPLERHAHKLLHQVETLDLRQHITPLRGACSCCQHHQSTPLDQIDSHFWLSFHNLKIICQLLYPELTKRFALNEEKMQRLLLEDLEQINALHAHFVAKNLGALLTNHPALSYFCDDLKIASLTTEHPSLSLTLHESSQLQKGIFEHQLTSILLLKPYQTSIALRVAKRYGLKPIEFAPYARDPIESLKQLAELLSS